MLNRYNPFPEITSFGFLTSVFLNIAFTIAGIAVVFYFIIGIIKLITSGGDKQAVSSAKDMITHAIVGLLLLFLVFIFVNYLPPVLGLVDFRVIGQ